VWMTRSEGGGLLNEVGKLDLGILPGVFVFACG
jgi:hypothetical protein